MGNRRQRCYAVNGMNLGMNLFPTLELTEFEQHMCSTKSGYSNALSLGTNSRKKRNLAALSSAHQAKKSSANLTMVGLERQQSGVYSFFHETTTSVHASSKTSEPKILVLRLNKVERNYIQEQEPNYLKLYSRKTAKLFETIFKNNNQIIPTIRTWIFTTEWTRILSSTRLVSE